MGGTAVVAPLAALPATPTTTPTEPSTTPTAVTFEVTLSKRIRPSVFAADAATPAVRHTDGPPDKIETQLAHESSADAVINVTMCNICRD
jgi:hypothetical protein